MTHPRSLGKYQIIEVLGEGAMGVVYKAFDPDIRRTVALKTIRALRDDPEGAQMLAARFRTEAQAAGRLSHPGIVAVYDFGRQAGDEGDIAFIAMEYIEGQTLAHYLSHKVKFTDVDVAGLMSQLLDALHHAHEQGVWHRDIKPANIILTKNGRLKVADFGIARIDNSQLTQVSTMLGTPAYMAPEQFRGQAIDRRVDVYAAGVMLYVLLTNRPPFVGSPESLMYQAVHETAVAPSQIDGLTRPTFYDAILSRAMAKEPDRRYASALDFKVDIEAALGQPVDTTVWERTIIGVPNTKPNPGDGAAVKTGATAATGVAGATGATGTSASRGGTTPWTQSPTNWDRQQLAQAESTLARFVGPLATVMVRRAARDCADLPALYARLAQDVTDPGAKAAFNTHLLEFAATLGGHKTSTTATQALPLGGSQPGLPPGTYSEGDMATVVRPPSTQRPVTEALIAEARKRMAEHVGPIASVMVKKAAAASSHRDEFVDRLVAALPDPEAQRALREAMQKSG
jgi:eukaryotic-like serine/threonine-protein kinase